MHPFRIAAFGVAAVIGFDAIASAASLALGFNYGYTAIGSCVLYATVGYVAGRSQTLFTIAAIGVVLGLADATLGWAVSWVIGPGQLPPGLLTISVWMRIAFKVIVVAVVCAAVGGLVGSRTGTRRVREA